MPKPLFEGAEAERVLATVDEIIAAVSARYFEHSEPRELADMLLLFATVAQRRELDIDFSAAAQHALDSAAKSQTSAILFDRLGYGLALENALRLLGVDAEICTTVDVGLAASVAEVGAGSFEFILGAAGRLTYLAQRPASDQNAHTRGVLLDSLAAGARTDADGTFWANPSDGLAPEQVDIGVAHGCAGVVLGLAKVLERGWGGPREESLLRGAVDWLLAQQRHTEHPFWYPTSSNRVGQSRLAWCYSDLGIAVALDHAARALRQPSWAQEARRTAENAAGVSMGESKVDDAAICHGAAGAGLLFFGLSESLGSPTLRAAAYTWFTRVEGLRQPEAPLAGFRFKRREGWVDQVDVIEGVSGIGLALELACSPDEVEWPRFWGFW